MRILIQINFYSVWKSPCHTTHVYKASFHDGEEGENNRIFAFWGRTLVPAAVFLAFLEDFCTMYSCSKSFRELKNAIKKHFFLYLGGLGPNYVFNKKKHMEEYWYKQSGPGKNIGSACFLYMGVPHCKTNCFRQVYR